MEAFLQPGLFGRGLGLLAHHSLFISYHDYIKVKSILFVVLSSMSNSNSAFLGDSAALWGGLLLQHQCQGQLPTSDPQGPEGPSPPCAGRLQWALCHLPGDSTNSEDQTLLGAIPPKLPAPLTSKTVRVGRVFRQYLGPLLHKQKWVPEMVVSLRKALMVGNLITKPPTKTSSSFMFTKIACYIFNEAYEYIAWLGNGLWWLWWESRVRTRLELTYPAL